MTDFQGVLAFWFEELTPDQWWIKSNLLDEQIRQRFSQLHTSAARCELFDWRTSPTGRLAEIIVLDQFSRNLYRDSPQAFAQDAQALALAQEAVALGVDNELSNVQKGFLYTPYMHSESMKIHELAVKLYQRAGLSEGLSYELKHQSIIERFGRYPHRNALLGRSSTAEELEFLKQPGSSF